VPNVANWAIVVLVLCLVFMFRFGRQIAALIDRTRKVGKGGLETYDIAQPQADTRNIDPIAAFNESFANPLLLKAEDAIRRDLEQRQLSCADDANPVLVRILAANQILNGFLRISQAIFASQLDYLMFLSGYQAPVPSESAQQFFSAACERFPLLAESSNLDAWLSFLQSWNLVTVIDNKCEISLIGREYLKWRVDESVLRPFVG